tara:strand:- start:415 stop:762 length:348 start_codon:yes stop_codon:yes gene_type:complete
MKMFGIDFLVAGYYILFSALLIVQQRALRAEKNSFLNSISDEYTTIKKSKEIMVAIGGFLQIISFIYFGYTYHWYSPFLLLLVTIPVAIIFQFLPNLKSFWWIFFLLTIYFEFFG